MTGGDDDDDGARLLAFCGFTSAARELPRKRERKTDRQKEGKKERERQTISKHICDAVASFR